MSSQSTHFYFISLFKIGFLQFGFAVVCLLPLGAVTTVWDGGSGLWSDSAKWSVRVPEPTDTVYFEHQGEATVTLPGGAVSAAVLRVRGVAAGEQSPSLILDMAGGTFSTVPDSAANFFNTTADAQGLVVRNGELRLTSGNPYFLNNGTNPGSLTIEGDGVLTVNGAMFLSTSTGATMSVMVENGGQVFHTLSRLRGGSGRMEIFIDGADAKWEQTTTGPSNQSTATIGDGFEGLLRITDGARFIGNSQINIGLTASASGAIEVMGTGVRDSETVGSTISSTNFYIGGGLNLSGNPNQVGPEDAVGGGDAEAHFLAGGRGEFTNLRVFYTEHEPAVGDPFTTNGSLIINGGQVTVSGSAYFDSSSQIHFGINSVDQDIVMDVGSLFAGGELILIVNESFSAGVFDTIELIEYSSLSGTFDGLGEGSVLSAGGYTFELTYSLGGDNVIGLTVIPEPAHFSALLGLALLVALYIRRRCGV